MTYWPGSPNRTIPAAAGFSFPFRFGGPSSTKRNSEIAIQIPSTSKGGYQFQLHHSTSTAITVNRITHRDRHGFQQWCRILCSNTIAVLYRSLRCCGARSSLFILNRAYGGDNAIILVTLHFFSL